MKKASLKIFLLLSSVFLFSFAVSRIEPKPAFSGIYVDNFNLICGNKAKEDSLIKFCQKEQINWVYFYDLNNIESAKLAAIVSKFHSLNIKASGVYVSTTSLQKRKDYNNTRIKANERLDGFNYENEYWNNSGTGETWRSTLLNSWGYTSQRGLKNDFYIGFFKNSGVKDTTQANFMVSTSNRALIHCYIDSARMASKDGAFTYVQERLSLLGTAAIKKGKVYNVEIIFAKSYKIDSETTITNNWFNYNSTTTAYNKVKSSAERLNWVGKKGINIEGKMLYNYSNFR